MPQLTAYRQALAAPGIRVPVLAAVVGRFPIAMVNFSLLLYTQRVIGTFAVGGALSAVVLVGVAVGAITQGRLSDRVGPSRPLLATTAVFVACSALMVAAVQRGASVAVLIVLALGVGVAQPSVGSIARAMWNRMLPPGPARTAALAYEAVVTEIYFILGPAVSGILLAAPWPGTGFVAGVVVMSVGTVCYASTRAIRTAGTGPRDARRGHVVGALASSGLRTVVLASAGMGLVIGFVEVAVPASANDAGRPILGGVLVGLWAIGSTVFGVAYGTRPWPKPLEVRTPALLAAFAVLVAPMALTGSLVGLATALILAGCLIAPQTTAHSEVVDAIAERGLTTESFGWIVTASTVGIGMGQAVGGQMIERWGTSSAYAFAAVLGVLFATLVHLRRHTIRQNLEQ